ncbi:MAG: hypothetical protein D6767_05010, partial [Candidatus Hydrogenedentota bacterium]
AIHYFPLKNKSQLKNLWLMKKPGFVYIVNKNTSWRVLSKIPAKSIVFSVQNPFPLAKLALAQKKEITWITSFSDSETSKEELAKFLLQKLQVKYRE